MINTKIIKNLTEKTGCYLFKNEKEEIIYIGKANNLKKRIANYFKKNRSHLRRDFISQIEKIEIIVTENQKEALILEQNLVKKNQPRYNILLKENNSYPYIHITKEKDPRYVLSYKIFDQKLEYFGPFPDGSRAKEILNFLERVLPLAKCKKGIEKKPCIYYNIGQCSGHCFKEVENSYYQEVKKNVINFFNGNTEKIKKKIKTLFKNNLENLSFEIAQKQKKILDSIDFLVSKQNVEFNDKENRDFLGVFVKNCFLSINILVYRYGKLLISHERVFSIVNNFSTKEEIINSYILQFYKKNLSPKFLYSSELLLYKKDLEEILKLQNIVPENEKMKKIMNLANSNAKQSWQKSYYNNFDIESKLEILERISNFLKINNPYYIEALDISNISLQNPIASFSYFINGEYNSSKFYELEIEKSDFEYMKQASLVHYKNYKKDKIPNLIVVDGSKEQVKSVKESLEILNLKVKVIGLVKNNKHKTEKIINDNLEEVNFEEKEDIKKFFSQIQDVVHSKAINYHRRIHIKRTLK